MRNLRALIHTTLHTVLASPTADQRRVMGDVLHLSARLAVMTQRGRTLLREVYGIAADRIDVIPHGIPAMGFVDPNFHKDRFGMEGADVLLTFGLLSPNRGIEQVIAALPAVVARHPALRYVVPAPSIRICCATKERATATGSHGWPLTWVWSSTWSSTTASSICRNCSPSSTLPTSTSRPISTKTKSPRAPWRMPLAAARPYCPPPAGMPGSCSPTPRGTMPCAKAILALARANYEIECDPASDISERIIFPYSPAETNGIEDARFVRFVEDDGTIRSFATYTAFDGSVFLPQFVETDDFVRFRVSTLNGPEIATKGMALFPRRIRGSDWMLSRQDGENIYLMESDMLHFWHAKRLILRPTHPWEYVQIGNYGSAVHEGRLIIPYSMSDSATTFATVPLADVLAALEP